ncbi:MAG TPA: hypothetical protein VNZ67_10285, partial [bacterium]|nr:hypothetical protein [bacterium]
SGPTGACRVLKFDASGNSLWARQVIGDNFYGGGLTVQSSGNVVFSYYGATLLTCTVQCLDANGNSVWSKALPAFVFGLQTDPLGDLVACGYVSHPTTSNETYLAKLASDGQKIWDLTVSEYTMGFQEAVGDAQGNVYAAGYIEQGPAQAPQQMPLLIKVASAACDPASSIGTAADTLGAGSFVFPDPVRGGTAQVGFACKGPGDLTLVVFNAAGSPAAKVTGHQALGNGVLTVDTSQFAQGVYYYHLSIRYDAGGSYDYPVGKFRVVK